MTLDEFLRTYEHDDGRTGLTATAFAAMAGLSQPQVSRLLKGHHNPSLATMDAIRRATGGKVTPNDWLTVRAA